MLDAIKKSPFDSMTYAMRGVTGVNVLATLIVRLSNMKGHRYKVSF